MNTMQYNRIFLFFVCFFAVFAARAEVPETEVVALNKEILQIEEAFKDKEITIKKLGKINQTLSSLKVKATDCIGLYQKKVEEKKNALKILGEKHKKESPELIKQRKQQEKDLADAESELANCSAVNLRIQSAITKAEQILQQQLATQLFAQGDDIFDVIEKNQQNLALWSKKFTADFKKYSWTPNASKRQLWMLSGILLLGILFGVLVRRYLTPAVLRIRWSDEANGRFAASATGSFCHEAPYLFASISMAVAINFYTSEMTPIPPIASFAYTLCFYFIARYVITFSLDSSPPGRLFLKIPQKTAMDLARRLKYLIVILLMGYAVSGTVLSSTLPDYLLSLLRSMIRIALAINLIWVLSLFGNLHGVLKQVWFRYGLSIVLVFAVIADLLGYTNLSDWLIRSIFGSLFVIMVILIIARLTSELLEGLEYGNTSGQRKLRRILGLSPNGHLTGFFWFRLLVRLGWWFMMILTLIFIWDLSASMVDEFRIVFTQGFMVGSLKIIPARIVLALVSLGLLVAFSAWFQGQMRKRWARKMPIERGAQEAMITVVGYIGVATAILITLGIAGIDYANLAIIAGALSLGIGFGLQNIVNNFISGLILLFERPIKTGDWIVVGNTEGYVKRIRMRATQIQTFDRADVIVPNSELISGQVTNWMLQDQSGRARIPIGVAYGSDTQKVKEVLLKVAHEHPEVIIDESVPLPKVLFRNFGDSSLNFELRFHIRNIDERINVISDLNFAIDMAFRENDIKIPFPQRDVHIIGPEKKE